MIDSVMSITRKSDAMSIAKKSDLICHVYGENDKVMSMTKEKIMFLNKELNPYSPVFLSPTCMRLRSP